MVVRMRKKVLWRHDWLNYCLAHVARCVGVWGSVQKELYVADKVDINIASNHIDRASGSKLKVACVNRMEDSSEAVGCEL